MKMGGFLLKLFFLKGVPIETLSFQGCSPLIVFQGLADPWLGTFRVSLRMTNS